jgi:hypothetical protein
MTKLLYVNKFIIYCWYNKGVKKLGAGALISSPQQTKSNLWEVAEEVAAGMDRSASHGRSASICATQPVAQFKSGMGYSIPFKRKSSGLIIVLDPVCNIIRMDPVSGKIRPA